MTFGVAGPGSISQTDNVPPIDVALLFNLAWNLLPHLILNNSLWSLKAVTLMVRQFSLLRLPV